MASASAATSKGDLLSGTNSKSSATSAASASNNEASTTASAAVSTSGGNQSNGLLNLAGIVPVLTTASASAGDSGASTRITPTGDDRFGGSLGLGLSGVLGVDGSPLSIVSSVVGNLPLLNNLGGLLVQPDLDGSLFNTIQTVAGDLYQTVTSTVRTVTVTVTESTEITRTVEPIIRQLPVIGHRRVSDEPAIDVTPYDVLLSTLDKNFDKVVTSVSDVGTLVGVPSDRLPLAVNDIRASIDRLVRETRSYSQTSSVTTTTKIERLIQDVIWRLYVYVSQCRLYVVNIKIYLGKAKCSQNQANVIIVALAKQITSVRSVVRVVQQLSAQIVITSSITNTRITTTKEVLDNASQTVDLLTQELQSLENIATPDGIVPFVDRTVSQLDGIGSDILEHPVSDLSTDDLLDGPLDVVPDVLDQLTTTDSTTSLAESKRVLREVVQKWNNAVHTVNDENIEVQKTQKTVHTHTVERSIHGLSNLFLPIFNRAAYLPIHYAPTVLAEVNAYYSSVQQIVQDLHQTITTYDGTIDIHVLRTFFKSVVEIVHSTYQLFQDANGNAQVRTVRQVSQDVVVKTLQEVSIELDSVNGGRVYPLTDNTNDVPIRVVQTDIDATPGIDRHRPEPIVLTSPIRPTSAAATATASITPSNEPLRPIKNHPIDIIGPHYSTTIANQPDAIATATASARTGNKFPHSTIVTPIDDQPITSRAVEQPVYTQISSTPNIIRTPENITPTTSTATADIGTPRGPKSIRTRKNQPIALQPINDQSSYPQIATATAYATTDSGGNGPHGRPELHPTNVSPVASASASASATVNTGGPQRPINDIPDDQTSLLQPIEDVPTDTTGDTDDLSQLTSTPYKKLYTVYRSKLTQYFESISRQITVIQQQFPDSDYTVIVDKITRVRKTVLHLVHYIATISREVVRSDLFPVTINHGLRIISVLTKEVDVTVRGYIRSGHIPRTIIQQWYSIIKRITASTYYPTYYTRIVLGKLNDGELNVDRTVPKVLHGLIDSLDAVGEPTGDDWTDDQLDASIAGLDAADRQYTQIADGPNAIATATAAAAGSFPSQHRRRIANAAQRVQQANGELRALESKEMDLQHRADELTRQLAQLNSQLSDLHESRTRLADSVDRALDNLYGTLPTQVPSSLPHEVGVLQQFASLSPSTTRGRGVTSLNGASAEASASAAATSSTSVSNGAGAPLSLLSTSSAAASASAASYNVVLNNSRYLLQSIQDNNNWLPDPQPC